jgi:hypothetical protein
VKTFILLTIILIASVQTKAQSPDSTLFSDMISGSWNFKFIMLANNRKSLNNMEDTSMNFKHFDFMNFHFNKIEQGSIFLVSSNCFYKSGKISILNSNTIQFSSDYFSWLDEDYGLNNKFKTDFRNEVKKTVNLFHGNCFFKVVNDSILYLNKSSDSIYVFIKFNK